ncbi:MAG: hypothetical protein NZ524_06675 [Thiobacillaceae bacterium]|nr:hypothetical protein [Thiobacillaceae bacterium]MCX7674084.1 hypothetical protein [Thiobacillaceae bacterium]MDW8324671.1 hypothetical protein [Burkholderiales bacterium]
MQATLCQGTGRRPLIRFDDGRLGIPVNLHFRSRLDFLFHLGRRVEVISQLSEQHYTVRLPGAPLHLLPWACMVGRRGLTWTPSQSPRHDARAG